MEFNFDIYNKLVNQYYNQRKQDIIELKKKILKMSYKSQEGHIASSFSILDILYVLYRDIMYYEPKFKSDNRDRFILSKAHASLGLSVILERFGFITQKDLDEYCTFDGILGGHLNKDKVNGVEISAGSLGHGLLIATGVALALKLKNKKARVFCLVGDCELQEGTNWESLLLINQYKLDNLILIIDNNKSHNKSTYVYDMQTKIQSFGFEVKSIDGHNLIQLKNELSERSGKPRCIICNTIKGKGIKSIENNPEWHHKSPKTEDELNQLIQELDGDVK